MAMTRLDISKEIATSHDLSILGAKSILDTVLEYITDSIKAGEKIELRGFGTFFQRKQAPRVSRNVKTGERVDVPAKTVLAFKVSKMQRETV